MSSTICRADSVLGEAGAFNLVALSGNIKTNGDVGGRVAAAGSVDVSNVGQNLINDQNGSLSSFSLVADGGITGKQVQVFGDGNIYAPGATQGTNFAFQSNPHGALENASAPIDFASLATELTQESVLLNALTPAGQVLTYGEKGFPSGANPQWLVLSGTSATLDVFNLTQPEFSAQNGQIDIVVPQGATVIVNVAGTSDTLHGQILINGQQLGNTSDAASNVLFNFDDATTLGLDAEFNGSILAPLATVSGGSEFDGTLVAAQIDSLGEVDNAEFAGTVPTTPVTAATPEPDGLVLFGTGMLALAGLLRLKRPAERG